MTSSYGHLPGSPQTQWFFAKFFLHRDRQAEVITAHLPTLLTWLRADLGDLLQWWFLRYRSPHESDHLRVRVRVNSPAEYSACAAATGALADRLRHAGLIRRLKLDTYYPEVGRYGEGPVMTAAETVFTADSEAVLLQLGQVPDSTVYPAALAAANIVDIVSGFTGSTQLGMQWLIRHPTNATTAPARREVLDQAVRLADPSRGFAAIRQLPAGDALLTAWAARRTALVAYRHKLPATTDPDDVLESLLHMHHIRAVGIDRDQERVNRRLARSAALAWQARRREHQ